MVLMVLADQSHLGFQGFQLVLGSLMLQGFQMVLWLPGVLEDPVVLQLLLVPGILVRPWVPGLPELLGCPVAHWALWLQQGPGPRGYLGYRSALQGPWPQLDLGPLLYPRVLWLLGYPGLR